jgi:biopolymer transport protein ExbD
MKLKKKDRNAKIPDDSMADIAFLLIIFFMLTTTFSVNKGFDFGIPPLEQTSSEDSESRPALTVIVDGLGDAGRNYRVIVVDEQGQQQNLNSDQMPQLYKYMDDVFTNVKETQANWWKLPVYVLVRENAPFEGFVDVWEEVRRLEDKWKKMIPDDDPKLATHIPHIDQVEEIITQYLEQNKLVL